VTSARPKPLTDDELARLEREGHTFGLPSGETRRLVSEVRRLRQLVAVAREHVEPGPATCPSCADTVKRILDDVPDAVPSTRAHNIKTCPVLKTEALEREEGDA
jgi:hypothetical protein